MPQNSPRLMVAATASAAGLLLASCGDDPAAPRAAAPSPTSAPVPTATATASRPAAASDTVIKTAGSDFGTMLFAENGQAIYLFDKEKTDRPDCYDECAAAWPPVLTTGAPQANGEVRAALLGTTKRTDGTTQVTYAGHPLYFYAHEKPNQVLCHNINLNGGLWFVVTPAGSAAPP